MDGPDDLDAAGIAAAVAREVEAVEAVDVHTHLLPPNHGALLLTGVDALFTYHYLVAELFTRLPTAPPPADAAARGAGATADADIADDDADGDAVDVGGAPSPFPTADEFFSWPADRQARHAPRPFFF